MKRKALYLLMAAAAIGVKADDSAFSPDRYNVVWDSPSADQNGSMPLGNGSTGLNAWIEPNGDLLFYISRTDSWGGNGRLLKVGRVRITLDPAPTTDDFLQTLSLEEGTLRARCGETDIRLWVDANYPVIHAELSGSKPCTATASVELWRKAKDADTVLKKQPGQVGWYHRNLYSEEPAMLAEIQGMADFKREDPLLHRTFGAVIKAADGQRMDDTHLRSPESTTHRFDIHVLAKHPATADEWQKAMDQTIADTESTGFEDRRAAHVAWWKAFWQRSWIHATPGTVNVAKKSLIPSNTLNFRFGMNPSGGNRFVGNMGRVSLFNTALSESEISKLAQHQDTLSGMKQEHVLFSAAPTLHSELPGSAKWTESAAMTAEVWIKPDANAGSVRILDKTLPGSSEGFLLDTHPENSLRVILGEEQLMVADCLTPEEWNHVAVVVDSQAGRIALYRNGERIAGQGSEKALEDSYVVSRGYALQRYMNACAARGAYPIKFNGSIFTVAHEGKPHNADFRRWGPGYWWQNTRMPYLGMCTSGDAEMTDALYKMYCQDLFAYHKHRAKAHTGHEGLYVPETMLFYGNHRTDDYGKTPFSERTDKLQESPWHKWEWVSGLELSFMMLDRYEHELDESFLKEIILPFVHEVLIFFDLHYETGPDGKLIMHPSQALETWWECTNPMPEVAGLHAVIDRLLALPEKLTDSEKRDYWTEMKAKIPALPIRELDGVKMFAPAEKFENRRNSEVPEMYGVFPFRLSSFEKSNAQLGIDALNRRGPKGYQGWRQDDIFMAYLGLTEQVRDYVVSRASTTHEGSRFPAFWGPNMDWIPDQTHGGVLMKAFQSMLLQTEGKKIFLLPAWPKDWQAEFKLHAPYQTVLEGRVVGGKLVDLKVTPESRRKDVVVTGRTPPAAKVAPAKLPTYHASVPKPTRSNIPYGSHERQVLDFWKAPSASTGKPAPLVLYIHGGSWQTGSKEIIRGCVDVNALLNAGISVAAINYRYVSQAQAEGVVPPVKAPLNDAARALQFVRSKAEEWHIDKVRIAATGASAGGCSSLWLAYHDDMADPASEDPVARESTRLFCAGVRVPQTSLDPQQMQEWLTKITYGGHAFGVDNKEFLSSREKLLPWIQEYSPYAHVSEDDPAVAIYYDQNLKDDLGAHSPQFAFQLQKRCHELDLFCEVRYAEFNGHRQYEATRYLIKTLTSSVTENRSSL